MKTSYDKQLQMIRSAVSKQNLPLRPAAIEKIVQETDSVVSAFRRKNQIYQHPERDLSCQEKLSEYCRFQIKAMTPTLQEYRAHFQFLDEAINFYEKELNTEKELTRMLKKQIDKLNKLNEL